MGACLVHRRSGRHHERRRLSDVRVSLIVHEGFPSDFRHVCLFITGSDTTQRRTERHAQHGVVPRSLIFLALLVYTRRAFYVCARPLFPNPTYSQGKASRIQIFDTTTYVSHIVVGLTQSSTTAGDRVTRASPGGKHYIRRTWE